MIVLESSSGPRTWKLRELWLAAGKPPRIIVAAYGPATCNIAGFKFIAGTGEACAAGAIDLEEIDGTLFGQPAGAVVPGALFALDSSLESVGALVLGVSIATYGVEWFTAQPFAKAEKWTKRKSWPDVSQKIRFESGLGSTPAVAQLQSATITKRTVKKSDFGGVEFAATDWIVPGEPNKIDMTGAYISATGRWMLMHTGATQATVPQPTPPPTTPPPTTTTTTPTPNGASCPYSDMDNYHAGLCSQLIASIKANPSTIDGAVNEGLQDQLIVGQLNYYTQFYYQSHNPPPSQECLQWYRDWMLELASADGSGGSSIGGGSSTQGPQGEPGKPGTTWYNGASVPSNGVGIDGDYYLQTVATPYNVLIYYKVLGSWTIILAL